jgi:hypothetical protein
MKATHVTLTDLDSIHVESAKILLGRLDAADLIEQETRHA